MEIPCWVHLKPVHQNEPEVAAPGGAAWNEASGMPHNFLFGRPSVLKGFGATEHFNCAVPGTPRAEPHQNNPETMWHASQLIKVSHLLQIRLSLDWRA
jgi:hypothetical protein